MVVVTGATGHLGTVLVRLLVGDGKRVRYLTRAGSRSPGIDDTVVERVELDCSREDAVTEAVRGADALYHAAARVSISSGVDPELDRSNVDLTRTMAHAAFRGGVGRFVHVGSIEAFPLEADRFPITERHGVAAERTVLAYGRSKAESIRIVLEATSHGLDSVICCPTAFIGPPDYRLSPIGGVIRDLLMRRLPAYVSGGFDFVDVRDVARGMILATERGRTGALYLLSGEYVTVPRILELVEEFSGVRRPALCLPIRPLIRIAPLLELYYRATGRPPVFTRGSLELLDLGVRVDSSRAREELGYTTRSIEETVCDTVRWFIEESGPPPRPGR